MPLLTENDFIVQGSTIEGAGNGLFSRTTIKPEDTIGQYTGLILSDEEVENSIYVESDYIVWVCKDCNIVGEGELANHTRFINHSEEPNCRMVCSTRWKTARIMATKLIVPDEEIFIDYGPYYWEQKLLCSSDALLEI